MKDAFIRFLERISKKYNIDFKYYLVNSSWILLGQFFEIGIGIGLSVIYAQFLSKEVYGKYNLILSIVTLLSILSIPGFNNSVTRSTARGYDGVLKKAVRKSFLWSLVGIPLLILIGAYYYHFDDKTIGSGLLIAAFIFPFYYAPNTWKAFLQGKSKFNIRSIFTIIILLLNTGSIVLAIFLGKGRLLPLFFANIISNTILNVIFYFISLKYIKNQADDIIWKKSGYQLTIVPFVSNIYNYLDKLLIGIMLGNKQLAVYSIATAIAGKLVSQQRQLLNVIKPRLYKRGKDKRSIQQAPKLFLLTAVFSGSIILILPPVMNFLYGDKYAASIMYAQLYMVCFPVASLNVLFSTILISINKENEIVKTRIIMVIINVVLYIILIPILEIPGAIIASIAYYLFNASIMYYFIKKHN